MAFISPEEYKRSKGLPSGGAASPSGYISPEEYKQRQATAPQPVIPTPSPVQPSRSELTQSGLLPPIDALKSSPVVQQAAEVQPPHTLMQRVGQALQGAYGNTRSDPVVGVPVKAAENVAKGLKTNLDVFAEDPGVKAAGEIGRTVYTPGGGAANVAGLYGSAGAALDKFAPSLASSLGGRVAGLYGSALNKFAPNLARSLGGRVSQEAIKEATEAATKEAIKEAAVGVPTSIGQAVASGRAETGEEMLKEGLIGGAFGAGLGGVFSLARSGIAGLRGQTPAPGPVLALPEPRQRGNVNQAETPDVIANPYTFSLPEATLGTVQRAGDTTDAFTALRDIDDQIRQLEISHQEAINNEYKFLKESRDNRGGVKRGGLIRDANGEVSGRYGRMSDNPKWYQDFYAENGKAPSNKDLMELARKRVDEGFEDTGFTAPGWRAENAYDENVQALNQARGTIRNSLQERVLNPTQATLRDELLKSSRHFEEPIPSAAARHEPEIPSPVKAERPPDTPMPEPVPIQPDMDVLGISPFAQKGKYTNPEDTRGHIVTKTERDPIDMKDRVNQFYVKQFDNLQRINQFDKTVEGLSGKKLRPSDRAYMLALNQRGADMSARHILTENLVNHRGDVIGPSLQSITRQIPRRAYDNFTDYLVARHAPTRMLRGERVYPKKANMTPEKVEAKIAEYEKNYSQFAQIADQLYEWNKRLGQAWLVDTGIIPQSMFNAWLKENPNWIPNKRQFTELEKRQQASGAKRGFANQKNPVKAYSETGSERPIIDPLESLIEYTDRYVKTARRNEVMQAVVKSIQRHPDEMDAFGTVLKREKVNPKEMTSEGVDGLLDSVDEGFDKALLKKSDHDKDNVVTALVDGEKVHVRIEDPALLDALTNLTPQGQKAVVEVARKTTNAMKLLTTGVNPIFGLTRNIFRDVPEAYIYSKTTDNPFRYIWDMIDGFTSVFASGASDALQGTGSIAQAVSKATPQRLKSFLDERARLYRDFKGLGGGHSSSVAADRNLLAQSKRSLIPKGNSPLNFARGAYGLLENVNNALESAPRLGEFKRTRRSGSDSYDSRIEGLFQANDITTNFKRHGDFAKEADAFFPYLNAALQGLDKFTRTFKDRPIATSAKAISAIALPTMYLYSLNHDNPNYQKLSNFVKDNFYLFPKDDGTFVRIPKPREMGVPFSGLIERALRSWGDGDPEGFRDFSDTVRSMFAPPGLGALIEGKNPFRDTVIGPLIELSMNENFMGAPIVPGYLEGLSPRHQYDANSSEVTKKIGDVLNVSPKKLEHVIRSYTGVLGQIGLPATTQGASVGSTLAKQMTTDPVFSTDASKYFYELKDKLDTQYKDARATGVIPKGYDDSVRKYVDSTASQMALYTKALRDIDKDESMSKEQKKDQKRELTEQRNEIAREAYQAAIQAIRAAR